MNEERRCRIEEQQGLCVVSHGKTNTSIPRRNDVIDRAEAIYKTISIFSMYQEIAFVNFNTGLILLCKEVGDITLCDLMEIAQEYTLGKIMSYSVDNMAYVAAYCRKLTE